MRDSHIITGLEPAPDSVGVGPLSVASFREGEMVLRPEAPTWGGDAPKTWRPFGDTLRKPVEPTDAELNAQKDLAVGAVFKEAYDEGVKAAKEAVETVMGRYHQALSELEVLREQIISATQEDLTELALAVAHESLMGEGDSLEAFTFKMVEHCLEVLKDADSITLKVSSTDMKAVAERHPELVEGQGVVKVVEDRRLNLGGVIAESELGRVDASIEKRFSEIADRVRRQLHGDDAPKTVADDLAGLLDDESGAPQR